jgi:hypothetical protein
VAADLNTHLRDNLNALKDPPTAHYEPEGVTYSTTSTTIFVDVDATNLALTIETSGGDVLVGFHGLVGTSVTTNPMAYFDIEVDGNLIGDDDGIFAVRHSAGVHVAASFVRLITGLSAGSHTFKLKWKVNGATGYLYANPGTTYYNLHPQFWVREVS